MINEIAAEDKQVFQGLGVLTRPFEVHDIGLDETGTLAGDGGMLGWDPGLGHDGLDDGLPGKPECVGHGITEEDVPTILATSILLAVAAVATDSVAAGAVRW